MGRNKVIGRKSLSQFFLQIALKYAIGLGVYVFLIYGKK